MDKLKIYNSLTRKKEKFKPLKPPFVGMYVCGPTVYSDPHLGHARPAITFDIVFRYLKHLGYKLRYVSNITDVGHLEDEIAGAGEDRIAKKARVEKLEPMEVVQYYTNVYHAAMQKLNVAPPSIEPLASGHIIEQIKMIEEIIEAGYGYEKDGSVYFDLIKYSESHDYGSLSGRVIEDMISGERKLEGQDEKRNKVDFALWKKATPEHLMQWDSPWGKGFPGWHLECSVMGGKYLGIPFDIHGGGMDLKFPHHESEIAQSMAAYKKEPVKLWMHNNMITIEGQKMSRSLNNFITIYQMFQGDHDLLEQAYSPMTLRFYILQTHYRSTLDFSNEALQAAERGFNRLMEAQETLSKLSYQEDKKQANAKEEQEINKLCDNCYQYMNDDFNTPQTIASLFDMATKINSYHHKEISISALSKKTFEKLLNTYNTLVTDILGFQQEQSKTSDITDGLLDLMVKIRNDLRAKKDYAATDKIRDGLQALKIQLKDEKDGSTSWKIDN